MDTVPAQDTTTELIHELEQAFREERPCEWDECERAASWWRIAPACCALPLCGPHKELSASARDWGTAEGRCAAHGTIYPIGAHRYVPIT